MAQLPPQVMDPPPQETQVMAHLPPPVVSLVLYLAPLLLLVSALAQPRRTHSLATARALNPAMVVEPA